MNTVTQLVQFTFYKKKVKKKKPFSSMWKRAKFIIFNFSNDVFASTKSLKLYNLRFPEVI